MRMAAARRLDTWLGTPLCFLLTALRRMVPSRPPRSGGGIRRLLFLKLAEQGATVLAYPALRKAVDEFGRDNVFALVFEENRDILDALGVLDEANVLTLRARGPLSALAGAFRAVRRIRSLHIDATVDLEFFARSTAAIAYLSGARVRVGLHSFGEAGPYRGDLLTHRLLFQPRLHTIQLYRLLVDAVREAPDQLPSQEAPPPRVQDLPLPSFSPTEADRSAVERLLQAAFRGQPRGPLVLLNPNASDLLPLRRWPPKHYVALVRRLLERFPTALFAFTGTRDEAAPTHELAALVGSPRCVSLAGGTTVRQFLTLCTLSDVLVTNDSGPAHFACLTPIRVVALFGPETPAVFGPRAAGARSLWAGLACSPCVTALNGRASPCAQPLCMEAISVEQVADEVDAALAAREASVPAPDCRPCCAETNCGGRGGASTARTGVAP